MTPEMLAEAAGVLISSRTNAVKVNALPENCRPSSAGDGYAIQKQVLVQNRVSQIGWKVAATNAVTQAAFGISEPFAGRLPGSALARSPFAAMKGRFNAPAVEGEFAVMLGDDLPPGGAPFDAASVAAAVACVIPAVEVVDGVIGDRKEAGPSSNIAAGSVAGLVLGRPHFNWRELDLRTHPVALSVNGETVAEGTGAAVLGDPMNALAWLANLCVALGEGLCAGEIITLGTCTGLTPVSAGDLVSVDYGALGTVELAFWTTESP
jgi:2-keto-4-pentenoate hydratase